MSPRRLFETCVFITIIALAITQTTDPDMWWHLRTGQAIIADGLPTKDFYSFTALGRDWITHEWLSQVLMWQLYDIGKFPALIIFFACLITVTFGLLYLTCDGKPLIAAFLTLMAALVSSLVWGARPQIITMFFISIYIAIIEGFRNRKLNAQYLWILPFTMLIWVNCHGGYLLGLVIPITYIIGDLLQKITSGQVPAIMDRHQITCLSIATACCIAATVANPNGIAIWLYPLDTLGDKHFQQYISEWQSPNFHDLTFLPFAIMFAIGIFSFTRHYSKKTFSDYLLFSGTAAASFLSARHIPIFAIVSLPILARNISSIRWKPPKSTIFTKDRPTRDSRNSAKAAILINYVNVIIVITVLVWSSAKKISGNSEAIEKSYPVKAVDFIEGSNLASSRIFNAYHWGGYLIWRGIPVYIDGRADVYGGDFLEYYGKATYIAPEWQAPLDDFKVEYVLLQKDSPLAILLSVSTKWREVYSDDVSQILVRQDYRMQ